MDMEIVTVIGTVTATGIETGIGTVIVTVIGIATAVAETGIVGVMTIRGRDTTTETTTMTRAANGGTEQILQSSERVCW